MNGFKEQWGLNTSASNGMKQIILPINYNDTNYVVSVTTQERNDQGTTTTNTVYNKNIDKFDVINYRSTAQAQAPEAALFAWISKGY